MPRVPASVVWQDLSRTWSEHNDRMCGRQNRSERTDAACSADLIVEVRAMIVCRGRSVNGLS